MSTEARKRGANQESSEKRGTEEEEGEGGGVGALDVIKAIAPLLVIIGLALGMLVLGYVFVPETFTTSGFQRSPSPKSAATPVPPPTEGKKCQLIGGAKPLITALKDFSRWKELGSALGVLPSTLEDIEKEHEEVELRKRAMLRAWYSGEGGSCWETLVEAVAGLEEKQLAQEIAQANGLHSNLV